MKLPQGPNFEGWDKQNLLVSKDGGDMEFPRVSVSMGIMNKNRSGSYIVHKKKIKEIYIRVSIMELLFLISAP